MHAPAALVPRAWLALSAAQLALGLALHYSGAVPANKDLYTFSFLLITSGIAGGMLLAFRALTAHAAARTALAPLIAYM